MKKHSLSYMEDHECNEVALLGRVKERDQAALERLYELYYPKLNRFLLRVIGVSQQQAVPDLVNEVMYVVWNKADTYNHSSKVSSWIFGIAVRIAKKYRSRQYRYEMNEQLESNVEAGPAEAWEKGLERSDLLGKAMLELSSEHKAVIELTYFNGLHYSEIAEIMNCPENTIKTRMYHARKRLRTLINEMEKRDFQSSKR